MKRLIPEERIKEVEKQVCRDALVEGEPSHVAEALQAISDETAEACIAVVRASAPKIVPHSFDQVEISKALSEALATYFEACAVKLEGMLASVTEAEREDCEGDPWLLDTLDKVTWANGHRDPDMSAWKLGDHCPYRPAAHN